MKKVRFAAVLAFASSLVLLPLAGSLSAASAAASAGAAYHGTPGSAARVTQAASVSGLPKVASAFRNEGPLMFTPLRPGGPARPAPRRRRPAPARRSPAWPRDTPSGGEAAEAR